MCLRIGKIPQTKRKKKRDRKRERHTHTLDGQKMPFKTSCLFIVSIKAF